MSDAVAIRRLHALPAELASLRAASEAEGFNMLAVLEREWTSGAQRFHSDNATLFGAFAPALVGIAGLTPDPYDPSPALGRLRRCYVHPSARRGGIGRALVQAVIQEARRQRLEALRLRAPPAAFAFYEALGFARLDAPRATHLLSLRRPPLNPSP